MSEPELVWVTCPHCHGTGDGNPSHIWDEELCRMHIYICPECSGRGERRAWSHLI